MTVHDLLGPYGRARARSRDGVDVDVDVGSAGGDQHHVSYRVSYRWVVGLRAPVVMDAGSGGCWQDVTDGMTTTTIAASRRGSVSRASD